VQVKIGFAGSQNSNVLELDDATNKGLLIPRTSVLQMGALNVAPDKLMIYNKSK